MQWFLFYFPSLLSHETNKICNPSLTKTRKEKVCKESEIYSLVQTLRGHEHDLGAIGHLQCPQRHRIDQNLPYHKDTISLFNNSRERKRRIQREREREKEPLKMSFWPRVRTLVRGWRRDLRSVIVESCERETGIDLPLNLTVIVMLLFWALGSLAWPAVAPASAIFLLLLHFALWVSGESLCVTVSRGVSEGIQGLHGYFTFWLKNVA